MFFATKFSSRLALFLASALLLIQTPAGAQSQSPTTLTVRTQVEAVSARYALVRLPKQVFLDEGFEIHVTGAGRAYGFALVQDDDSAQPGEGAELYGFQIGFCNKMACKNSEPHETPIWGHNLGHRGDRAYLPASTYRLYVITDGSRVEVEMIIPGLERGTQAIALERPLRQR